MSLFDDALQNTTLATIRNRLVGFAQGAGLVVTAWLQGDVGEQILEAVNLLVYSYTADVPRIVRGYASLDTSTDPGDEDAFDVNNVNLEPAPGFLSNLGENVHGTVRSDETFADGFVTFVNNSGSAKVFAPDALVFTWTGGSPPSPAPTYRNAADATIYFGGTVTVPNGTSIDLPVRAEEIGVRSNAPATTLSLTTTMVGCTATNTAAVLATARESPELYRAHCRQASARLSFDGPADTYKYLAAKTLDGDPLINVVGAAVNITKTYVSQSSATGNVNIYFASPSGPAIADDVTAANENILINAFVVPDAITIGPGSPGGVAATGTAIHVAGTCKVKQKKGGLSGSALQAAVKQAIVDALTVAFESDDFNPIGGVDQDVDGNGVIYTVDLAAVVRDAYAGVYDVAMTLPAVASVAITTGHVATLTSATTDWTVTVVP